MFIFKNYHVKCTPLNSLEQLKEEWLQLESQSNCSFFLSWSWISTWLSTYNLSVDVLQVQSHEEVVGLALLIKNKERRFGVLNSTRLLLHETGIPALDQIWIEYNGILTNKANHSEISTAALKFLVHKYPGWDELIIGAISESEKSIFEQSFNSYTHIKWQAPSFGVNLAALKTANNTYLSSLSRNTRYQINRSQREFEKEGEISLTLANNTEDALQYFHEISSFHIKRWGSAKGQSGFSNPAFVDFHHSLIKETWKDGVIDIWKLTIGKRSIGYFYNFIYKNQVYFYLSGLAKSTNTKLKPGLLGHALCIQHYIENNIDYYDFMGGDERYKKSLATKKTQLYKLALQKPLNKFWLEHNARNIKNKVLNIIRVTTN